MVEDGAVLVVRGQPRLGADADANVDLGHIGAGLEVAIEELRDQLEGWVQ